MDGDPRVWTIGDVNRRASLAVVRDFRGPVWIVGELARLDERHGHRWLELVERGGGRDGRDAHLEAFCSATKWQRLERKLGEANVALRPGQRLTVVGSLDVGDRGKLSLTIDDVDIAALVGDRLRDRRRLVERLVADDLFDANRRLPLTPLPLRVGLVASAGSDGHHDVVRQLEMSGFAFQITLQSVPVEGPNAARLIKAALVTFGPADVDVVLVVRGGGAKASLDVFDSGHVAHAIATAAVPVWTGIGHTGDTSVADEVAHRCFPTPTALGQALVGAVRATWAELDAAMARVARLVTTRLDASATDLRGRWRTVSTLAGHQLAVHEERRAQACSEVRRAGARGLDVAADDLTVAAHRLRATGTVELRDARRQLAALAQDTADAARRRSADSATELAAAAATLPGTAVAVLHAAARPLARARELQRAADHRLRADEDRAASRRAVLEAYDPARQLARGWTLTHTADGRLLRHAADVSEGDVLVTTLAGGTTTSTVTNVTTMTTVAEVDP
jgi:exodeoxyribonuclease VII large subunit